ncbi:unnamed protein product [Ambrosiozyma monospora]|uniref:Unnamed protein product n=1 Tax=Ambrosiozyma monospora TaxID=43982 RepID=A0ACB5TZF3_AMBMO|nr:unnamed protein product [Ambrosiozyma monospora]
MRTYYNGNLHIAEERGLVVDDSGVDEEDKYSGVIREKEKSSDGNALLMGMLKGTSTKEKTELKPVTPGAYIPPRQRAANFHGDPAVLSSSATSDKRSAPQLQEQQQPQQQNSNHHDHPSTIPPKPTSVPKKPNTSGSSVKLIH